MIRYASFEAVVLKTPATERTHYEKLNEFLDPVYAHISKSLKKFGFVNGDVQKNASNSKAQIVWWMYGEVGSCCYRYPCTDPKIVQVAAHHASAHHRKEAILNSIKLLKAFMTYRHGL
jgi:hypothetical protein